jgi:hypothetical protein
MKHLALLSVLCAFPAFSEVYVDGDTLVYSAKTPLHDGGLSSPQDFSDADKIGNALRDNPEVRQIAVSGLFPNTHDALDVAHVISDFEVNVKVEANCSDGCLYILMAGKKRDLKPGALLQVRRPFLRTDYLQDRFASQSAVYGWADQSGQAAFMYDRAQTDMRDALGFLLDHGVSLDFALHVFDTPRQELWTPTREELAAGVWL